MFKRLGFINIFLLGFWVVTFAQSEIHIEQIGTESGLSQGWITCIVQDEDGFIWGGTQTGLNRYEGTKVRIYRHDPFDSLSLPGNFIKTLFSYQDYLLIGTIESGLSIFHKESGRVFQFPSKKRPVENTSSHFVIDSLPQNSVGNVRISDDGSEIWVATGPYYSTQKYIYYCRIKLPPDFWSLLPSQPAIIRECSFECWKKSRKKNYNWELLTVAKLILAEQENKLFVFDYSSEQWQPHPPLPFLFEEVDKIASTEEKDLLFWHLKDGTLWLQSQQNNWRKSFLPKEIANKKFVWGDAHSLFFQTDTTLFRYATDGFISSAMPEPIGKWNIPGRLKHCIQDKSGNFFCSVRADGLIKINFKKRFFEHYHEREYIYSAPLPDPKVDSFFIPFPFPSVDKRPLTPLLEKVALFYEEEKAYINSILPNAQGQYWAISTRKEKVGDLGKTDYFLVHIDPFSEKIETFFPPDSIYKQPLLRPNRLNFDAAGRVWTSAHGHLISFEPNNKKWNYFSFEALNLNQKEVYALDATPYSKNKKYNTWWLATAEGLIEAIPDIPKNKAKMSASQVTFPLLPEKYTFKIHKTEPASALRLMVKDVLCVQTDPGDPMILWIGTKGGGLYRLNTATREMQQLTKRDGLVDDVIYGILTDEQNHLWLSTNKGLIRYNTETSVFKTYKKEDGLQENEFNTWSYSKTPEGKMIFGGINGLTVFHPDSIQDNDIKSNTFITGLKANTEYVYPHDGSGILDKAIEYTKKVVLPHYKNDLTLEFASLEYTQPDHNLYTYYLEGAEEKWKHRSLMPEATYLNLQPGQYTFLVKGSNNDEVFGDQAASLIIIIRPPWYKTPWAFWTFLILSLAIAGGALGAYLKRLTFQKELALKEQEIKHLERMHEQKLSDLSQKIIEKSQLIHQLKEGMPAKEAVKDTPFDELQHFNILTKKDWEDFKKLFEKAYPGFQQSVNQLYPDLTQAEFRFLLLAKLKLSKIDMADMLGIAPDSVRKTRQRLQKKLATYQTNIEAVIQKAL